MEVATDHFTAGRSEKDGRRQLVAGGDDLEQALRVLQRAGCNEVGEEPRLGLVEGHAKQSSSGSVDLLEPAIDRDDDPRQVGVGPPIGPRGRLPSAVAIDVPGVRLAPQRTFANEHAWK